MKTIICAFALILFCCYSMAADALAERRIAELAAENKELRSEIKEWEEDIKWQRRLRGKVDRTTGDLIRYNRTQIEGNEKLIADLKAGKAKPAPVAPTNAAVYAPRYIIVPETNPPVVKAATNTPPPEPARPNPFTRGREPATKILPPRPATKVIFP